MRPRPVALLRESARIFRQHPVVSTGLGAAFLLSSSAVCCGFGLVAAPWFFCELFALQLSIATGRRPDRTRAWLGAALFLLGAVILASGAAWIATLGMSTSPPVPLDQPPPLINDVRTAGLGATGAVLALIFIGPFLYAPLILIDRGGTIGTAVLESASLVAEDGILSHLWLSVSSHVIQIAPVLFAAAVVMVTLDRGIVVVAVATALPFVSATLPLGQGMIVSAWAERRHRVHVAERSARRTPFALRIAMAALLLAPAGAFVLVLASLARPSAGLPARAPAGELVADIRPAARETRQLQLPMTALSVSVSMDAVTVTASDQGGVGRLPRPEDGPIHRLRIVRVRDSFAFELDTAGGRRVMWIDRAGARTDDDLQRRLACRVPPWGLLLIALVLVATPLLLGGALVSVARARRLELSDGADARALALAWASASRRAWLAIVLLAPLSAAAVFTGIMALWLLP